MRILNYKIEIFSFFEFPFRLERLQWEKLSPKNLLKVCIH